MREIVLLHVIQAVLFGHKANNQSCASFADSIEV